ncbi:hypothetical protein O6H91_11G112700 [Diphasiastrum complanatum]|uniref:Uncharacterized protein n=1 Tax=Diphasiastrum complanatum TaxID=34168 RepID=A0ACC2CD43_DIPCM|nr:hypothetical protein O6H91_11G112700 [Diphasiastrum complanatum]
MDYVRVEESRIVVALDFGTTFSGFAYALRADPNKIYTFYDWPMQDVGSGRPYCKTQTSLWYMAGSNAGTYQLMDWGWPASVNYSKALQSLASSLCDGRDTNIIQQFAERNLLFASNSNSAAGFFLTKFKLHLADEANITEGLPPGLRVEVAISDYLSALSKVVLKELRERFGSHICLDDIQWCITVPVIWEEHAKQQMKRCAELAGLVAGSACGSEDASRHPLILALEPEAASVYCQQKCDSLKLEKGDKVLVADIGGGTVDIVVHEIASISYPHKVREISRSSGGLCGGSFVDLSFFKFLSERIGCFSQFAIENAAEKVMIAKHWDYHKYEFDGSSCSVCLDLPGKLAAAWEAYDASRAHGIISPAQSYDEINLTEKDMKKIFDPVVGKILALVDNAIVSDLKALMLVGGFSSSPYLMRRIQEKFGERVGEIIRPPNPGSAVCSGAVTLGISKGIILARVSRKTYGIYTCKDYKPSDPYQYQTVTKDGRVFCRNHFDVFVRVDEEVPNDHSVTHFYYPLEDDQERIKIVLYSSSESHPKYTTEAECTCVGSFFITFPSKIRLGVEPSIVVRMYFGRSNIEVSAKLSNSGKEEKAEMLSVKFEKDFS